jgi:hypothetical protein
MMTDGNMAALNRMMKREEKYQRALDAFEEWIGDEIVALQNEYDRLTLLASGFEHDNEAFDMTDELEEAVRDILGIV